jgi:membrane-bound ClpP family serine protease
LLPLSLLLALVLPDRGRAEGEPAGLVLPIPSDRTTLADMADRLKKALEKPLQRIEKERSSFRLILDFNPEGSPSKSDNFGACYELARKVRELQEQGVQTVAYVHGTVSHHSVLPVLACGEIVMSKDPPARLGPVVESGKQLSDTERNAYLEMGRRYPSVLVRKLYDSNLAVIKVAGARGSEQFRDAAGKPPPQGEPIADLGRNQTASYDFDRASTYGLCQKDPRNDVGQVLHAFQLPRSALSPPPDLPTVWQMTLTGSISGEMSERVQRHVKRALGRKANVLIFKLECGDGDSGKANDLALFLAHLNDNRFANPVETIAYVTPEARNTAAFLALACDKIVMHPQAKLGDFERYLRVNPSLENAIGENLADVARIKHYPAVLARGMIDPNLRIHWALSARGDNERLFLSEKQFQEDNRESEKERKEPRWKGLRLVKPAREEDAGKPLTLDAVSARDLGVAQAVTDKIDGVYSLVGAQPGDVSHAESDFLDAAGEFLRNPWTRLVLIMVGITCLILELKMPGVSLPGVIAAICFVLFFWSHSQMERGMMWLAMLLFLLGLALLLLEIFVIPGFGVCGLAGIVLVLGSLGLVAYGHWPRTPEDWMGYGRTLGPMGLMMLGSVCLAFLLAHYLPSIPYANRLFLKPQVEENGELVDDSAPLATRPELAALLGAIGVAATPLRPAGKVQFSDNFIDVVAEGSYVQPGARVQVIEIEGNRVVVKEV